MRENLVSAYARSATCRFGRRTLVWYEAPCHRPSIGMKLLAVIPEVRKQSMCVKVRVFRQLVIQAAGKAVAGSVIEILLDLKLVEGCVSRCVQIGNWLYIVDAATVVVITVAEHQTEALALGVLGPNVSPPRS